jgi:hypothetical protein
MTGREICGVGWDVVGARRGGEEGRSRGPRPTPIPPPSLPPSLPSPPNRRDKIPPPNPAPQRPFVVPFPPCARSFIVPPTHHPTPFAHHSLLPPHPYSPPCHSISYIPIPIFIPHAIRNISRRKTIHNNKKKDPSRRPPSSPRTSITRPNSRNCRRRRRNAWTRRSRN